MKLLIGILAVFVVPLALLAFVLLLASLRFHGALAPCIAHDTRPVVLYEGTYITVEYPMASRCTKRYLEKPLMP